MTHPSYETLDVRLDGGVCTVTLNRPRKFNAMSIRMRRELGDCFNAIADDTAVRVVLLTGAGEAFCGGGDINDFEGNSSEHMHDLMARTSHRWFKAFWNLPQPVVGAINGAAAGGGCNLALACDVIYASETAYFRENFIEIGLVPDLGGAWLLPRLVGLARAKEMALFGERVEAREALALGMVNAVKPADELLDFALQRARKLAERPPATLAMTKRMFNRAFESSMESLLDDELSVQSFLFSTAGNRDGVDRFLSLRRARAGN